MLFACSEGERAFEDSKKQQSIFTYYLLEALSGKVDGKGPLELGDVVAYVRKQVVAWAAENNKKQTPELLPQEANQLVLADKIVMAIDDPHRQLNPQDIKIVLFDGNDTSAWRNSLGQPAAWRIEDGVLEVVPGTGDILTKEFYGDCQLHLEFNLAYMPQASGQDRSNSGVILNGQYEIQILDSVDNPTYFAGGCGAIYGQKDPDRNVCMRPGEWQTYDITFRTPRLDRYGRVLENPRITVIWNGVKVHNYVEIGRVSYPGNPRARNPMLATGPLILQDHGAPVRFRNIWIKRLD